MAVYKNGQHEVSIAQVSEHVEKILTKEFDVMIARSDLSNDEYFFLVEHKIHWENLFDARGRAPSSWDKEAKDLGCDFGLSEPCFRGHRLRDRKGHCIQCKTANISFIRRSSADAFVYVAASKQGKLYKVGSTIDFKQRAVALRREQYAGCKDWRVICVCKVKNSGKTEFEVHKKLSRYKVSRTYKNAGQLTSATEVFQCDLKTVWQAYQVSVDWPNLPEKKKNRVDNFSAFDYQAAP